MGRGAGKRRNGKRRRGRRNRPLDNQARYVISRSRRYGVGKRSDRLGGLDTMPYVYSANETRGLRAFADALTGHVMRRFPEVRRLDQLEDRHVRSFAEERGAGWSEATRRQYASLTRKLVVMTRRVYGSAPTLSESGLFGEGLPPKTGESPPRASGGMSQDDWEALNARMLASSSGAKFVPFITRSIGTRIEEACSIRPGDIDLGARVVRLRNCKNGRNRDVPIPGADLPMWRAIRSEAEAAGWPTVCAGIRKESASRALRRALEALGLSGRYPKESNHAIRKLYAREAYLSLLDEGADPVEAWQRVQIRLGHGPRFRKRLFDTYVGIGLRESS